MLKLTSEAKFTNNLGLVLNKENLSNFCQLLVDCHLGIPITLENDFCLLSKMSPAIPTTWVFRDVKETPVYQQLDVSNHKACYSQVLEGEPTNYKILTVELSLDNRDDNTATKILQDYIKTHIPSLYKPLLELALCNDILENKLLNPILVFFGFKDGVLSFISDTSNSCNIETYNEITLVKQNKLDFPTDTLYKVLVSDPIRTIIGTSYSNYYARYNNKFNFFVTKNYMRFESYEIDNGKFSLLFNTHILGGSYYSNAGMVSLLTILTNPKLLNNTSISSNAKLSLSKAILELFRNTSGNIHCPINIASGKRQVCPVLTCELDAKYITMALSDSDGEFVDLIDEIEEENIYTKHKHILIEASTKDIRGCKSILHPSGAVKVMYRDSKKKLSDEEAYKNRIFRDYLSHAISMITIPLFQKDFVIPEYLQSKFKMNMVNLAQAWYKPGAADYYKPRLYQNYNGNVFTDINKLPEWVKPDVPITIPVKVDKVNSFIASLASRELTSATHTNSSIFTRHFVEPFIEVNGGHSWETPKQTLQFGWMFGLDSQVNQKGSGSLASTHLLRSSCPGWGTYYADAGLVSDKTVGVKNILSKVMIFDDALHSVPLSMINHPNNLGIDIDKVQNHAHACIEIYTANFVPNDTVEDSIKAFTLTGYSSVLARINQLLFLSEDNLAIMKAFYSCKNFTELTVALDLFMPTCLSILDELDYSLELKNHTQCMLTYFWDTTKAISEGLNAATTIKPVVDNNSVPVN